MLVRLSVAAEDTNAHALRENEACAARAKSWVFIREERGGLVVGSGGGDGDDDDDDMEDGPVLDTGDAGVDGLAVGCQSAGTLASSSVPMMHSSGKVVLMSEGAWTSE